MIDRKEYDAEARGVIDVLVSKIREKYGFKLDSDHTYMKDGVSRVITKGDVLIYFFWDWMEAEIVWKFRRVGDNRSGIDYMYVEEKYPFYERIKSYRKYISESSASQSRPGFNPKIIEKSYLDYLDKWTAKYKDVFEKGDYSEIEALENYSQTTAGKNEERELIDQLLGRKQVEDKLKIE